MSIPSSKIFSANCRRPSAPVPLLSRSAKATRRRNAARGSRFPRPPKHEPVQPQKDTADTIGARMFHWQIHFPHKKASFLRGAYGFEDINTAFNTQKNCCRKFFNAETKKRLRYKGQKMKKRRKLRPFLALADGYKRSQKCLFSKGVTIKSLTFRSYFQFATLYFLSFQIFQSRWIIFKNRPDRLAGF